MSKIHTCYSDLIEESKKIDQPSNLNITLMEHQKTIIYAMKEYENKGMMELKDNNMMIEMNIGILGDRVGSGKSLEIVTLILLQRQPPDRNQFMSGSKFLCTKSITNVNRKLANLLIIPHKILPQWVNFFKYAPELNIYVCNTSKLLTSLKPDAINNYDVVILTCTNIGDFISIFSNIKWSRIIVDEADTIKMPMKMNYNTSFLWLITGTPAGLQYSRRLKHVINPIIIQPFGGYIFKCIQVASNVKYLDSSMILPVPNRITIKCLTPNELIIIKDIIPKSIISMINAGNTDEAVKTLNCNVDTNENILQVVTKNIVNMLNNKNIELKAEKKKTYNGAMKEEQEKKIVRIEHVIERLETKYKSIKEKIYDLNSQYCPICMSEFTKPVVVACCKNVFCFDCIVLSIEKTANQCPYCRQKIGISDFHVIAESSIPKKNLKVQDVKEKIDVLMDIINLNPNGKFLVFANFFETFQKIEKKLNKNKITHSTLKGHTQTIQNILKNFTEGKIKILMLNAKYFGAGMNLQMATDIVIYHRFSKEMEEQVIGRAQRKGRVGTLNVYYLMHDNEDNNLIKEDTKFEDMDYMSWIEKLENKKPNEEDDVSDLESDDEEELLNKHKK